MSIRANNRWSRAALTVAASVLTLIVTAPLAVAQEPASTAQQQISIPAGPLDDALIVVSETFSVIVIATSELVAGRMSPGASGALTAEEAIDALLIGSDLAFLRSSSGAYVISERRGPPTPVQPSRPAGRIEPEEPTMIADTVIVTGERIERSLYETASSVAVTTSEDLERFAGPDLLARVLDQTANVSTTGENNDGPTIRGSNTSGILTSAEAFFGGAQPRTTIQVDGRQISFNEFVFAGQSAWDIDRVEVFRGPQTTSQGRNAIAGAIFVETANPEPGEFSGKVRGLIGEDATRQVSGALNVPITGTLTARVAADYRTSELPITILEGSPEVPGVDPDGRQEITTIRGKLLWEPSDRFDALLTLNHSDTIRPQGDSVDPPFEDRIVLPGPGSTAFSTNIDSAVLRLNYRTKSWLLSNTFTITDSDAMRFAPAGEGTADINLTQITNETTANYNGERIDFLAGVYVTDFSTDDIIDLSAFGLGLGDFVEDSGSIGVFGEGTYALTERLFATVGLRYQRDRQDRSGGFGDIIPLAFDESFDAFLPKAEIAFDVNESVRVGALAERGFNPGGFTFSFDTFEDVTFLEETLWNYEVFARVRRGLWSLNANAFYTDFDNLQVATLVQLGPDFFANVFSNVPSARAIGGEVELRFNPTEDLNIQAGIGFTDTQFTADSLDGSLLDGNDFERAPLFTGVLGVAWTPGPFELSAFTRYSDGYFSDDENLEINRVDSFVVVDLQAAYNWGPAHFYLSVTNVFDEFFPVFVFGDVGSAEPSFASVGPPRQVMGGIQIEF